MNEYLHILTDPAHLFAEATIEMISGALVYPLLKLLWRRWIRRHDEECHAHV